MPFIGAEISGDLAAWLAAVPYVLGVAGGVLAGRRLLRDRLRALGDKLRLHPRASATAISESLGQALGHTLDVREITKLVRRAVGHSVPGSMCAIFTASADHGPLLHSTDDPPSQLPLDEHVREALAAGRIVRGTDVPGATARCRPALLIPLRVGTHLEGVLALGPKTSGTPYGARDLELLNALAGHVATALRNAASYGRVTELLSSLERRVEERTRELRETQAELQASNEKLRELDRLKTQFFAEVSHELRTPLTLVLGPLDQLRRHAGGWTADTQRLLDVAYSSSAKLLVLTDTLLDLSRLDAGRMQPVLRPEALGPLVERIAEPFRWLAEQRGLVLHLGHADPSLTVWCDAGMVSKVVGNLLANALKFTRTGRIDVDLAAAGEQVRIVVADTGPGIAPDELPHIFERYRQASTASHSSASGSGLGLALVRELTELHGGRVEVRSDVGRGTTFTVWLPAGRPVVAGDGSAQAEIPQAHLAALAAAGHDTAAAPSAAGEGSDAATALVVDDNPDLLDFVRTLLAADYTVHTAANATEALALAQQTRPDIILCDVMMPGPDGIAFCHTLRADATLRHVPIILLTARASLESKLSGLDAGADDYVTKPFQPEELKARMRALLRMRQMERQLSHSHAELARAYDELRAAQAQLVHAEKMASLGTLVAGVAHEINNPVSFINSSIDLISTSIAELRAILDRHLQPGEPCEPSLARLRDELDYEYRIRMLQENAAICRDGASRAARIVGDLRTFCRPGSGRRAPADLHDSLEQSLRLLQGECKGRITVHREYGQLPPVRCDEGQMSQVFMNLLANAIQAIDGPGDLFVRTRSADGTVTVEIEDTGHGIDPALLSRLFDPFFTTKEVGKGTGLGLSIVRSLVTAHGGDVQVRSTAGAGTVFTVTLPLNGGLDD
jgi:signal transduction histidine kinase